MYLKEFWLDLSYDIFGIGPQEYVSEDDPSHNAIGEFFLETKCITTFFERIYDEKISAPFERILVECHKRKTELDYVIIDKLCTVNVLFDYDAYKSLCYEEKKKIILNTLMRGIKILAEIFTWDIQQFENVEKHIIDANYINQWIWKTIQHKATETRVDLVCSVDQDSFRLTANLYDKHNEIICSKDVITDSPDSYFYQRYFGKTKWKGNSTLEIYNKGGKNAVVATRVDFSEYLD